MSDQETLKLIRLICEKWEDRNLCDDGTNMKHEIIEALDGVIIDNLDSKISQINLIRKAKLWDRAVKLADEGKMLKYLENELEKLSC